MVNRQNHTYKIRNCANNKEVKSLVSAHRLKPYHDPLTRPTNPPPEHANDDAQLDPDELDQNTDRPADQPARQNAPAVPNQANNPPRVQNRPPRQNRRQNQRPQQHNQRPQQHNQPTQQHKQRQQNQQPQQGISCNKINTSNTISLYSNTVGSHRNPTNSKAMRGHRNRIRSHNQIHKISTRTTTTYINLEIHLLLIPDLHAKTANEAPAHHSRQTQLTGS